MKYFLSIKCGFVLFILFVLLQACLLETYYWNISDWTEQREARRLKGPTYETNNDSYDMGNIVMPLHEYINDPVARDIIHNGATFQV